jgi:hypothetical protein
MIDKPSPGPLDGKRERSENKNLVEFGNIFGAWGGFGFKIFSRTVLQFALVPYLCDPISSFSKNPAGPQASDGQMDEFGRPSNQQNEERSLEPINHRKWQKKSLAL